MPEERRSLAEAIRLALDESNGAALEQPDILLDNLMNHANPALPELRVLERNLDGVLLAPYVEAARCSEDELRFKPRVAERKARACLEEERIIDSSMAHAVSEDIAKGVALWRGAGEEYELPAGNMPGRRESSLVGEARLHGAIGRVEYELDTRHAHAIGVAAVLQLRNVGQGTVDVTVKAESARGKFPKKNCKNIPSKGAAVIIFEHPVIGVESIDVKHSNGRSPNRRLAAIQTGVDSSGAIELKVNNVTNGRVRMHNVTVMDNADNSVTLRSRVDCGLDPGEGTALTASPQRDRGQK